MLEARGRTDKQMKTKWAALTELVVNLNQKWRLNRAHLLQQLPRHESVLDLELLKASLQILKMLNIDLNNC